MPMRKGNSRNKSKRPTAAKTARKKSGKSIRLITSSGSRRGSRSQHVTRL